MVCPALFNQRFVGSGEAGLIYFESAPDEKLPLGGGQGGQFGEQFVEAHVRKLAKEWRVVSGLLCPFGDGGEAPGVLEAGELEVVAAPVVVGGADLDGFVAVGRGERGELADAAKAPDEGGDFAAGGEVDFGVWKVARWGGGLRQEWEEGPPGAGAGEFGAEFYRLSDLPGAVIYIRGLLAF